MKDELASLIESKIETGKNSSQIKLLNEIHLRFKFNSINFVETGCIRDLNTKFSDGWGTLCWLLWAKKTKSRIYSVDVNDNNLNAAKKILKRSPYINYIYSDSVEYLENLPENFKIDVLFLDSFDFDHGDFDIQEASSNHQLKEIKACEKNLNLNSLILIDDIFDNKTFFGKGSKSIPYLLEKKWKIINYQDKQILLSK